MGVQSISAARKRTIVGEKTVLECDPDYFIVPRKYSVEGDDAIRSLQGKGVKFSAKSIEVLKRIDEERKKAKENNIEFSETEFLKTLKADELDAINETVSKDISIASLYRLQIKYGLAAHNFLDKEVESSCVGEDVIAAILDDSELAKEVCGIIGVWNSPLARTTSEKSATLPNGDSEVTSSPTIQKTQD